MEEENLSKNISNIIINYNNDTYNLENPNAQLEVKYIENLYTCISSTKSKYNLIFNYIDLHIDIKFKNSEELLLLYVIMQYVYDVNTIKKLYDKENWDYTKWSIVINSINNNELSDHLILLNTFLNLKEKYNSPLYIKTLENEYNLKIKDKRGLGGERPRELNYKYGFPYFTSSSKKNLNNSQRLFVCPFPIETINPQRKAVIIKSYDNIIKCFTCGCKEGEINIFGNICNFEKGHLTPITIENTKKSLYQCKWCNTFYKDKIIWCEETGKPKFNCYAILRDMKKKEIICSLKKLGITSTDLL